LLEARHPIRRIHFFPTMVMLRTLLALCVVDSAIGDGKYVGIGKWRGTHGGSVGLCTAELIAKEWILTAEHCATRILKGETVKVQVEFAQSSKNVKRGVKNCVSAKSKYDVDIALCSLKTPVNAFAPLLLNSDHYKTKGPHGKAVDCVGTSGGYHTVKNKVLEYEGNGAHLYVNNAGGSGMKAGDSGGAWVHKVEINNKTELVLSGVIHGGSGSRGEAGQVSHIRDWIDRITKNTTTWVSAKNGAMGAAVESVLV